MKRPTLRALVAELRSLNEALDGPWTVALCFDRERWDAGWGLEDPDYDCEGTYGIESLPGDDMPFDAVAAARRLLAALRDGIGTKDGGS